MGRGHVERTGGGPSGGRGIAARRPATARRDWGEAELDLALQGEDCPACALARQTEDAVLSWMANVNLREAATVDRVVRARGLCGRHWDDLLGRLPDPPGPALIRLLRLTAEAIGEDLRGQGGPPSPACPVCASMASRARTTLAMVTERLRWPESRTELEASFGLCHPHLREAIGPAPTSPQARVLLDIHHHQLGRLVRLLTEAEADPSRGRRAARLAHRKLGGSVGGASGVGP